MRCLLLEREQLADGNIVELSRIGRRYNVMITENFPDPPTIYPDLFKHEAYDILGDILEYDVAEGETS